MKRALLTGLISAIVFACPVLAQTVRGTVRDSIARPIANVEVSLLDSAQRIVSTAVSNEQGEFRLRAVPGVFQLRSRKIGFRANVTAFFHVDTRDITQQIVLARVDITLEAVQVLGETGCRGNPDSWATAVDALKRMPVSFGNNQDSLRPASKGVETATPEFLHRYGHVVADYAGKMIYYSPSLDLMASLQFLGDHCFSWKNDGDRIAIDFTPKGTRIVPDVKGTIWLDRITFEPRSLNFTYTYVNSEQRAVVGGDFTYTHPQSNYVTARHFIYGPALR